MNYMTRQQINSDFKARTLTRADYKRAMRALRVALQPQAKTRRRTIDDSALTLAIRLFGATDGKRIWAQAHDTRRRYHKATR